MRAELFSKSRLAACCLLLCGLFITPAGGATNLASYKMKVARAIEEAQTIIDYNDNGTGYPEGLQEIKRQLPRTLEVEQDGRVVVVDNGWLHEAVDSFASQKDSARQKAVMEAALARLLAIGDHLETAERERAGEASDARAKAKEIVGRSEYRPRGDNPITAFIKEQWGRVAKFLSDLYISIMTAIFGSGGDASLVSQIIIILLLALALFGAARLAMKIDFKRAKKKQTVLGEEIEADVTAADLAEAAMAAAGSGDFRLAMRKLYLSLLYELGERDLIELEPDLTNREYLGRVSKFAPLAEPMRYLTERFDQVWYGMFPVSQADFSAYLASYKEASGRAKTVAAR